MDGIATRSRFGGETPCSDRNGCAPWTTSHAPFDLPRPTPINEETTMTETTRPQRIFVASDLSARCDRALARAALLART